MKHRKEQTTRDITIDAIEQAATSIYDVVRRTPLVPVDFKMKAGNSRRIYLKLETLQPIGSFKIRGAYNAVRKLTPEQLRHGIWTVSAGNAAQGVALAAQHLGTECSVLVIDTAPDTKLEAIKKLGAKIVKASYDECWESIELHRSSRMSGCFVHPFDNDDFISGNGTIALELLEDLPNLKAVVASVGGGGLLSGIGAALRKLRPDALLYAAEPETAAPLAVSLAEGRASVFPNWQASFVDGAGGKSVLPTMWPLLSDFVAESIVVSLEEIITAMRDTARQAHIIAEGAAACAVAAALTDKVGDGPIVAVVSGGNIDLEAFTKLIKT